MYRWLKAFLTESFIRTRIKEPMSRVRPLADGLPHGSALSCTLFLIFMNNIGKAGLTPNRLPYADDIVLWQQDTDIDKAIEAINRDLASFKRFCERWKMRINTGVANSVRERTTILQKLAETNWGATPQSLRTIYVSFIRPVLEYANSALNLASRTSLNKLDRVQNAASVSYWGPYGATQLRSWSSQPDASRSASGGVSKPSWPWIGTFELAKVHH
ncbi:RNA-directed DNA polymerase from mobile element jockey-like [Plakobranchus ocellatus]|uniref:RNA-directed DNA polymerase from mobile element jockey-like n=1 Tax=Plakobranchus ocellatus TaxID=259542 RepID=A0AAV4A8T9_9GAST|nr:RNA-directed DNA polymerase from mobile element jockey-like [Plakobranchus ocellatus]